MEFIIAIPGDIAKRDNLELLFGALEAVFDGQLTRQEVYQVHTDNPVLVQVLEAIQGKPAAAAPVNGNGNGKVKGKRGPYKKRGEPAAEVVPAEVPAPVNNPIHVVATDYDGAGVMRHVKSHGSIKGRRL